MRKRKLDQNAEGGVGSEYLDLVNSYLVDAHGPLPRVPLRFWVGGEWVEMPSTEPESEGSEEAVGVADAADTVVSRGHTNGQEHPGSAAIQVLAAPGAVHEPVPAPAPVVHESATPAAVDAPPLPIYEWVGANSSGPPSADSDWPRSLLPEYRPRAADADAA